MASKFKFNEKSKGLQNSYFSYHLSELSILRIMDFDVLHQIYYLKKGTKKKSSQGHQKVTSALAYVSNLEITISRPLLSIADEICRNITNVPFPVSTKITC